MTSNRIEDLMAECEGLYDTSARKTSSSIYSSHSSMTSLSDGSIPTWIPEHLAEFLDGKSADIILNNSDPESLLPMLARVLAYHSKPALEENELEGYLRRLFRFAAAFRGSARSFSLVEMLPGAEAREYYYTMKQFLISLTRYRQPLAILQEIFHHKLNLSQPSRDTQQLVTTILVDLPFLFEGWVNLWIGLAETEWCSIWSVVCYIQEVEDRVICGADWLSRQGQWASVCLASKIGVRAPLLLQNQRSSNSRYHVLPQAVEVGLRGPGPQDWERQEHHTKTLMILMGQNVPNSAPRRSTAGTLRHQEQPPGIQRHLDRPRAICWEIESPSKNQSVIDNIVSEYAQQPRLRSTEEEDQLQELARRQRSEEEFNKQFKRIQKERRLKRELEKLCASGAFGNETRRNLAEMGDIFSDRRANDSLEAPLQKLLSTIVEQDKEIDDTRFETWARELLQEAKEEPEDGDCLDYAHSLGSWHDNA
ncbi:hypothetical protein Dda_5028 [Drechslerella dactyloides]|uniref:Uncharacterized protein n=1 Tax=Drechslerella dactyloides TaxID=74499 RepID=A0AAD6NL63_DREDA|nr:hypothetical protein Dda_5028 [Drechslerella dactyloides]